MVHSSPVISVTELIANRTVKVSRTQPLLDLRSKMCKAYVDKILEPDKFGKQLQPPT